MRANVGVCVVVGNPKPQSRTRSVAERVAERAALAAGLPDDPLSVIEVSELGGELFDWSSASVKAQTDVLARSRLAVVASPTYKATYTGLLKSFLDWFGQTGLDGVTVIPVMVGASAIHALAVEVHLRPVLIEIGATVPTRGLFVLENEMDRLDDTITQWLEQAGTPLANSLH